MTTLFSLNDWKLNRKISPEKRMAFVTIYLEHPDWKVLAKLEISKRRKFRNDFLKANFQKLLDKKYFDSYKLKGTKRLPRGVEAKIPLASLSKLARLSFIDSIYIKQLDGAKKKIVKPNDQFFCVKMTVSIQVEGFTTGMQTCEDRYVLIKAPTFQSAYKRIKKQEKEYGEPYINSDMRLVRWKIESYDDCYCTDIMNINDLNNPKGVEIFSKFRTRKIPQARKLK